MSSKEGKHRRESTIVIYLDHDSCWLRHRGLSHQQPQRSSFAGRKTRDLILFSSDIIVREGKINKSLIRLSRPGVIFIFMDIAELVWEPQAPFASSLPSTTFATQLPGGCDLLIYILHSRRSTILGSLLLTFILRGGEFDGYSSPSTKTLLFSFDTS